MRPRRPLPYRRTLRAAAAAGCAAAVAASLVSCEATEKLTTGMKVKSAVEKLGDSPSASVIATVDATPQEAYRFLEKTRGGSPSQRQARLLSRAELTMATSTGDPEKPIKEMDRSEAADVAASLNFGGPDVAEVRSVDEQVYMRVGPQSLAQQAGGAADRRRANEAVELAGKLPGYLASARDALQGKWVRINPYAFDSFARVAQSMSWGGQPVPGSKPGATSAKVRRTTAAASSTLRDATGITAGLNGQAQREFLTGVEKTLAEHASFKAAGQRAGADVVRISMPAHAAARDLADALKPLGVHLNPADVPEHTVHADLSIRRGQLTNLSLDLGQFAPGGTASGAHLPLRLELGGGAAIPVWTSGGAKELKPQDLVAAAAYEALDRRSR
ncbi:hypothetical protein [Streptomyces sp. ODS28]|uniref:hypothetical protein n=1 Tax=Streptomyces sp. ODS28 TaxID=3136688 RepID=UPI0031EA3FCF